MRSTLKSRLGFLLVLQILLIASLIYAYFSIPLRIHSDVSINISEQPKTIPLHYLYITTRVRNDTGTGSGIIISKDRVLSVRHCVPDTHVGDTCWLDIIDEKGPHSLVAKVEVADDARDLAVLRVSGYEFTHFSHISSRQYGWGEPVLIVGCPDGNFPIPGSGTFVHGNDKGGKDLVTVMAFPGNSGGGIFDAISGEVVGLADALPLPIPIRNGSNVTTTMAHHILYTIPSKWITQMLAENNIKL